jgi:hypothetical protein
MLGWEGYLVRARRRCDVIVMRSGETLQRDVPCFVNAIGIPRSCSPHRSIEGFHRSDSLDDLVRIEEGRWVDVAGAHRERAAHRNQALGPALNGTALNNLHRGISSSPKVTHSMAELYVFGYGFNKQFPKTLRTDAREPEHLDVKTLSTPTCALRADNIEIVWASWCDLICM